MPTQAQSLARHLSTLPKAEDFLDYLEHWDLDERALSTPKGKRAFRERLKADASYIAAAFRDRGFSGPVRLPAHYFFQSAVALDKPAWVLHLTRSDPFRAFDRGASPAAGNIALSRRQKPVMAKCPENLLLPWNKAVYGYGFPLDESGHVVLWEPPVKLTEEGLFTLEPGAEPSSFRSVVLKYGSAVNTNGVLFRTDQAVLAYHKTDMEWQIIFPICSEYDAVPLTGITGSGSGYALTDRGPVTFQSLREVIDEVEADKVRRARAEVWGRSGGRRRWLVSPRKAG